MRNVTFVDDEGSVEINHTVSNNENIVAIKRRLTNETNIEAKFMKLLTDQREVVDDNILLPDYIDRIFYREVDNEDVIIKIKRNVFGIPKYIQINVNNRISDLQSILLKYSGNKGMIVFDINGSRLHNEKTIKECQLEDNSVVKVWKSENLQINLKMFNPLEKKNANNQEFPIMFSVKDSVQDVKVRIWRDILKKEKELKLYLFTESFHLQDKKQLMDYPVRNGLVVFYVDLIRDSAISEEMTRIKTGTHGKQFKGTLEIPGGAKEDLFLISYSQKSTDVTLNKMLKYEIVTRLKLCEANVDRFVQLKSIFERGDEVYIASEFLRQGSLRDRLKNGPFVLNDIIGYSIQILEGLKWMHDHLILHRNINCSSVLLGDSNYSFGKGLSVGQVKLCNFRLSKFLYNNTTEQSLDGIPGSKIETDKCWLAPEVVSCEPYGVKADIWSVGATIIEMMTGKRPYAHLNMVAATQRIVDDRRIEYDRKIHPTLNSVIDQFTRANQWERPSAGQAIQTLQVLL